MPDYPMRKAFKGQKRTERISTRAEKKGALSFHDWSIKFNKTGDYDELVTEYKKYLKGKRKIMPSGEPATRENKIKWYMNEYDVSREEAIKELKYSKRSKVEVRKIEKGERSIQREKKRTTKYKKWLKKHGYKDTPQRKEDFYLGILLPRKEKRITKREEEEK